MEENILHGILENSFYPLRLGNTAQNTLQEFIDIDVTTDDLVRILNENPAYKDIFASFVTQKMKGASSQDPEDPEKQKEKKPTSPTHRLIALLGILGSRNFILALRMHKAVTGEFPSFAEDKKIPFNALTLLKRSLEIEELFIRNMFPYSETVFSAALAYDWLYFLSSHKTNFKKLEPYFQEVWKNMKRYAILGHELAIRAPSFGFHKFAAAGAMLTQLGKLQLALSYTETPSWIEFDTSFSKADIPNIARIATEKAHFNHSSEEFSALSLHFFSVFKNLEPAIRYYREPYFLKYQDPTLYSLAIFLELVDSLARPWKIPADEKDPIMEQAKRPWQYDLHIPPKKWMEALSAALNVN